MDPKKLVAVLAVAAFIQGCIGSGTKQSDDYAVQGCAAGGLGAGLLAYFVYKDDDDASEKVAVATVMGCLAGAVTGYQVGKRTENYASAEQAAREEIELNRSNREKLEHYNRQLESNIKDYRDQISRIRKSNMSQSEKRENLKQTKDILQKQHKRARESLKDLNTEIATADKQYKKYRSQNPPAQVKTWRQEIAELRQERTILSQHVDTLNALDSSI